MDNLNLTRRIRIWERKKCIATIDIHGDTIVPRLNKPDLKVSYEAFTNDLEPHTLNSITLPNES